MRWTPGGPSNDVEDERGSSGGGFGFGGAPIGIGGAVVLLVLSLLFGRNFFSLVGGGGAPAQSAGPTQTAAPASQTPEEAREFQFVNFSVDDIQATWDKLLPQQANTPYHHAKVVVFRDAIQSACGTAQSATGPFYCPENEKVYLDLGFYDELKDRFGAPGEFAQAYVLAHELGHHVQNILGISGKVEEAMRRDPQHRNNYSERLELQADCLAGVWGHSAQQRDKLDPGDVEAGLNAAASVGDDRLQKMSGRQVNPDSFTHGSAHDRAMWFKRGMESGNVSDCDTFKR